MTKYHNILKDLPFVKAIVVYSVESLPSEFKDSRCYLWNDFIALGKNISNKIIEKKIDCQNPGSCCALFYTSGTTGHPKGVMISHDNLTWAARRKLDNADDLNFERIISFLPASHIAGFMAYIVHFI